MTTSDLDFDDFSKLWIGKDFCFLDDFSLLLNHAKNIEISDGALFRKCLLISRTKGCIAQFKSIEDKRDLGNFSKKIEAFITETNDALSDTIEIKPIELPSTDNTYIFYSALVSETKSGIPNLNDIEEILTERKSGRRKASTSLATSPLSRWVGYFCSDQISSLNLVEKIMMVGRSDLNKNDIEAYLSESEKLLLLSIQSIICREFLEAVIDERKQGRGRKDLHQSEKYEPAKFENFLVKMLKQSLQLVKREFPTRRFPRFPNIARKKPNFVQKFYT